MFSILLNLLPLLPMQALSLMPLANRMKHGLPAALGILAAADLLLFPLLSLAGARFGLSINLLILISLPVFFAIFMALSRCPVCKTLSSVLLVLALQTILGNIACAVYANVNPSYSAEELATEFALFQLAISTAVAGMLIPLFRKYGSHLVDSLDLPRIWYMTLPFSLLMIITNQFVRPLRFETLFVNNVFRAFLFTVSASLVLWCLLTVIFHQIVTGILDAARTEEKMRLLEMQESQFQAQQEYLESFSQTRHDFRQNVLTMRNLFHQGQYEALGRYIDEYTDSMPVPEVRTYCRNSALNALLNYYTSKAKELGFAAVFRIDLPADAPVSDVDLCTIIGNILENAIRACAAVPKERRKLTMTVQIRNGHRLYIVATNSFGGANRRQGSGIGLKSVQACAEKYGGTVAFSHDENEYHSDVMLMLSSGEA